MLIVRGKESWWNQNRARSNYLCLPLHNLWESLEGFDTNRQMWIVPPSSQHDFVDGILIYGLYVIDLGFPLDIW